jgi:hypothetical protein
MAPAFERWGGRLLSRFAGVLLVEASKQLYAMTPAAEPRRVMAAARPRLQVASRQPPSHQRSDNDHKP